MSTTSALLFGLTAVLVAYPAAAVTVNLAPLKDNTLAQQTNPASQLSGGVGDVFVGRTGQDGQNPPTISIRRGLIAFDIAASVPAGATITAVALTMRETQGNNGDQTVSLHRLSQDWGEGTSTPFGAATNNDATWLYTFFNSATPSASPAWTIPGGNYLTTASAATVVNDDAGLGVAQLFTWSSAANPQMIADAQQWLTSPATNFGWIMIGNEAAGNTAKRFNGDGGGVAPVLRVDYVPEPASGLLAAAAFVGILSTVGRRRPS